MSSTSAKSKALAVVQHVCSIAEELRGKTTKSAVLAVVLAHSPPVSRSQLDDIQSGT